jgi:hypothetical protein
MYSPPLTVKPMLLSSGAATGPVYPVTGKVNLIQEAVMEGTRVSNTPL